MRTKDISKYLRSAILVGNSNKADLSEGTQIDFDVIKSRCLDEHTADKVHAIKGDEETVEKTKESNVILVLSVLKCDYDMSGKKTTKDPIMEGVLHVPAFLKECNLYIPSEMAIPWIPLDLLISNEYDLTVGDSDILDKFLTENSGRLEAIFTNESEDQWEKYIDFARDLYISVVDNSLLDDNYKICNECHIVKDKTVSATFNISELYNDIINENINHKLYTNFISLKGNHVKKNLNKDNSSHLGSMNNTYELSPSQRESIVAATALQHGDILAVSGPPGTGKTTLLQSVISNMLVHNALTQSPPPIIVATSTNNKAVTNVIESFVKSNASKMVLEKRWISNVNSYATFFPSGKKFDMSEYENYQKTNTKAKGFISEVESPKNRESSKRLFEKNFEEFFGTCDDNLKGYKKVIHKALLKVNGLQMKLIEFNLFHEKKDYKSKTIKECIDMLNIHIADIKEEIEFSKKRISDWNNMYARISIFHKIFAALGIKKYKLIITGLISSYCNSDESFYNHSIGDIVKYYCDELAKLEIKKENTLIEITEYEEYKSKINIMFQELNDISSNFSNYLDLNNDVPIIENNKMDISYRYVAFLLAVKYYEVCWLLLDEIEPKSLEGTSESPLKQKLEYLSYLTPCFVSTAYMLPGIFKAYVNKTEGNWIVKYLYEKIDMLIVDEAGQISPEILACSFALAKKAIVVGDVNQIAPVYNINTVLDKYLAIKAMKDDSFNIGDYALNSSESSVMKVADNKNAYSDSFMLKEHRRCYDSIINFNNELIYEGKLNPLRGNSKDIDALPLPYIGYVKVECEKSERVLTSRRNLAEARKIVEWLEANYMTITDNKAKTIGIISPFKTQASLIKKLVSESPLKRHIDEKLIGTVHTFQGDEKDIVIFSTTYGSEETCSFLDSNRSILNVAVSRAKDHFLVFTTFDCLSKNRNVPTGLLREYIKDYKVEI